MSQSTAHSTLWSDEVSAAVRDEALRVGFARVGIVDAKADAAEDARFAEWVEAGYAGEMEYLKRRDADGRYVRGAVQRAAPWARSVVVCAFDYNSGGLRSIDRAPAGTGWIARYAQSGRDASGAASHGRPEEEARPAAGTDYHLELLDRLRHIERVLQALMPCESRCYVDTGPIVERALAERAGVGWVGKNTCVIDERLGSWLLLGVILTSLEVAPAATASLAPDRCGSCTRCIDACPTDALIAPRQMDASRCIAYLTIEKKGSIAEELRAAMGRQVFGCDICQDVCPWNNRPKVRRGPAAPARGMETRQELVNPPLAMLASMDNGSFKRWFKGSPLERTGRKRLQRNVAIAMGNSGEQEFRPQLAVWAEDDDAVLAEAARWALEKLDRELIADL